MDLKIGQRKDISHAISNRVFISEADSSAFKPDPILKHSYCSIKGHIYTIQSIGYIEKGFIGLNKKQREFLKISITLDNVTVTPIKIPTSETRLALMKVNLSPINSRSQIEVKSDKIEEFIKKKYKDMFFEVNQEVYFEFEGNGMIFHVADTQLMDSVLKKSDFRGGRIDYETEIECSSSNPTSLKIINSSNKMKNILRADFRFDEMGVGGLDNEIEKIFRRAFSSRRIPPVILEQYGIKHVKGLILYGPPGTGKTLIARQLAKALQSREPKIVNGPELFNKYVGETEKQVRELFSEAKSDQRSLGDQSPLHVIIFDEFDAIAKQRGSDSSGTGVGDNVVNQLLSVIDGVEQLENILVIGMTNRLDLIDRAVLRPGRFEVHIEVGLADEEGRQKIFEIHTKNMVKNGLLGTDVSLRRLSQMTKNYTGAEIEAIVKSASSFSLNRCHNLLDFSKRQTTIAPSKVEDQDFKKALEEIRPEFGIDTDRFKMFEQEPFFEYGSRLDLVLNNAERIISQLNDGSASQVSLLLYGIKGTGKTTIAARIALKSSFPFIKIISADDLIGKSEYYKTNFLIRQFEDAYKSPKSLVILDDLERLIEHVDVRKSFNNNVLQTILVLINKRPRKPENSIAVICTSSNPDFLSEFDLYNEFSIRLEIPELECNPSNEIMSVIKERLPKEANPVIDVPKWFKLSIKKLLFVLNLVEKDENKNEKFDKRFKRAFSIIDPKTMI